MKLYNQSTMIMYQLQIQSQITTVFVELNSIVVQHEVVYCQSESVTFKMYNLKLQMLSMGTLYTLIFSVKVASGLYSGNNYANSAWGVCRKLSWKSPVESMTSQGMHAAYIAPMMCKMPSSVAIQTFTSCNNNLTHSRATPCKVRVSEGRHIYHERGISHTSISMHVLWHVMIDTIMINRQVQVGTYSLF